MATKHRPHFHGPGTGDRRADHDGEGGKSARYSHYRQLYEEAKAVHGVSLWQDAWRRLRRNYVAMASLMFLCLLALLSVLTPLLPLQSPISQDVRNRQFEPPNFHA